MINRGNKYESCFSYLCEGTLCIWFWKRGFHGDPTGSPLTTSGWPNTLRCTKGNRDAGSFSPYIHLGLHESTPSPLIYLNCRFLTPYFICWQLLLLPSLWANIFKFFLVYDTSVSHSALDSAFPDFGLSPHYRFYLQSHPQVLLQRKKFTRQDREGKVLRNAAKLLTLCLKYPPFFPFKSSLRQLLDTHTHRVSS